MEHIAHKPFLLIGYAGYDPMGCLINAPILSNYQIMKCWCVPEHYVDVSCRVPKTVGL